MGHTPPLVRAVGICLGFAVLEGVTVGTDASEIYTSMRLPPFSPPFWAWLIIGVGYYVVCVFVFTVSSAEARPRASEESPSACSCS